MRQRPGLALPLLGTVLILVALPVGSRPSLAQMGAGRAPSAMGGAPTESRPGPPGTPDSSGRAPAAMVPSSPDSAGKPPAAAAPSPSDNSGRPPAAVAPPFNLKDQVVIEQGSTLFATTCSYCHKRLQSSGAPDATPTLWDRAYEKEYLFKMISEGPPSRRMPAWKYQYSTDQIWKLVAYILSLQGPGGQPR
jgi:mono/diheme cytochrome c family protein